MTITSVKLSLLSLLILASFIQTQANSAGPPVSACDSMMPNHGVEAQTGPNPFSISPIDVACWRLGQNFKLRIAAKTDVIMKGIFIQARQKDNNDKIFGHFEVDVETYKNGEFGSISCPKGKGLIHKKALNLNNVEFDWVPSGLTSGNIYITYTVVKDKNVFWVKERAFFPQCVDSNPTQAQSNSTQVQSNSTQVQSNSTQVQSNPTQVQSNPTQAQSNPTQAQSNPTIQVSDPKDTTTTSTTTTTTTLENKMNGAGINKGMLWLVFVMLKMLLWR